MITIIVIYNYNYILWSLFLLEAVVRHSLTIKSCSAKCFTMCGLLLLSARTHNYIGKPNHTQLL